MQAKAIVICRPGEIALAALALNEPGPDDLLVETLWSGISTGTERLFFSGAMPEFPGMGYPLVPGYESVGRVVDAAAAQRARIGEDVFIPGAACFSAARGLFGATASHLVVPAARAVPVAPELGERAVLLALAATAMHAMGSKPPALIVGHGVLGRLLARLSLIAGGNPVVWESAPARRDGAAGYTVRAPEEDAGSVYPIICDASGDRGIFDRLIRHLAPGGELVLAGFYPRVEFAFPPAFMREARLRIAAQWQPADLAAVNRLVAAGTLCLDGLISHRAAPGAEAYAAAFDAGGRLKTVLDWSLA